ncbi:hypothetical protein SAMN02745126_05564 [Enhydrobacter aerosaccus]|uniref:Invasion protein IalB, involved in pathogenesis n=1 Tax=Enhydrobacter aerosaccus TaxID=225324 RepID=A0A1T4T343_9HYPH|nr:hypothetical protein [Enhydrobacter aerosaccus]SKA34866.1 hypothetical protein SAMN02745126_05564 [Enhydrobacter aerosaccus]
MWRVASVVALSVGLAVPALARDTAKWGQVGGWQIMVDRTVGNGCFASQVFEHGTAVRIGFDINEQAIYLLFGNDDWQSLEVGKIYPMRIVFDDGVAVYDGEMQGAALGDESTVFLSHHDISPDFVKDFMERNVLQVFYQDREIARLSLANTYKAVAEILNCQKELGFGTKAQPGASSDPFARPAPVRTRDPFSR